MVRLTAKGRDSYVTMSQDLAVSAESGTRVVMRAFTQSLDTVLELVTNPDLPPEVYQQAFATFIELRRLYEEISNDMEKVATILQVIEQRLIGTKHGTPTDDLV